MRSGFSLLLVLGCMAQGFGQAPLKEPRYTNKPGYLKLQFHKDRSSTVWVVRDGNTLYVDRNGNADLTEANEKITAKKQDGSEGRNFEVGDLTLGQRIHKLFNLEEFPLARYKDSHSVIEQPQVKEAFKKDPNANAVMLSLSVQSERLQGGGPQGRLDMMAGFYDPKGVLQFSDKPEEAAVIHFDGPLEVAFYGSKPSVWKINQTLEPYLVVGTSGQGPGSFAELAYSGTIPETACVVLELTQKGEPPVIEKYELKQRC
jgi:hypothetical protein